MAEAKKTNPYSKLMHLVIGIVAAFLISRIPGPGGITPLGMALIGTFLVANYWFISIDMITGGLAAMVLYVVLAGVEPAPVITGILGNTTVWQILIMLPLIYGLRVTGATDALSLDDDPENPLWKEHPVRHLLPAVLLPAVRHQGQSAGGAGPGRGRYERRRL